MDQIAAAGVFFAQIFIHVVKDARPVHHIAEVPRMLNQIAGAFGGNHDVESRGIRLVEIPIPLKDSFPGSLVHGNVDAGASAHPVQRPLQPVRQAFATATSGRNGSRNEQSNGKTHCRFLCQPFRS